MILKTNKQEMQRVPWRNRENSEKVKTLNRTVNQSRNPQPVENLATWPAQFGVELKIGSAIDIFAILCVTYLAHQSKARGQ